MPILATLSLSEDAQHDYSQQIQFSQLELSNLFSKFIKSNVFTLETGWEMRAFRDCFRKVISDVNEKKMLSVVLPGKQEWMSLKKIITAAYNNDSPMELAIEQLLEYSASLVVAKEQVICWGYQPYLNIKQNNEPAVNQIVLTITESEIQYVIKDSKTKLYKGHVELSEADFNIEDLSQVSINNVLPYIPQILRKEQLGYFDKTAADYINEYQASLDVQIKLLQGVTTLYLSSMIRRIQKKEPSIEYLSVLKTLETIISSIKNMLTAYNGVQNFRFIKKEHKLFWLPEWNRIQFEDGSIEEMQKYYRFWTYLWNGQTTLEVVKASSPGTSHAMVTYGYKEKEQLKIVSEAICAITASSFPEGVTSVFSKNLVDQRYKALEDYLCHIKKWFIQAKEKLNYHLVLTDLGYTQNLNKWASFLPSLSEASKIKLYFLSIRLLKPELTQIYLQQGIQVNYKHELLEKDVLLIAVNSASPKMVKLILDHANINNFFDLKWRKALVIAENSGLNEIQDLILNSMFHNLLVCYSKKRAVFDNEFYGFSYSSSLLNYQNTEGNTLLHLALNQNDTILISNLLDKDVNIFMPNYEGETAFQKLINFAEFKTQLWKKAVKNVDIFLMNALMKEEKSDIDLWLFIDDAQFPLINCDKVLLALNSELPESILLQLLQYGFCDDENAELFYNRSGVSLKQLAKEKQYITLPTVFQGFEDIYAFKAIQNSNPDKLTIYFEHNSITDDFASNASNLWFIELQTSKQTTEVIQVLEILLQNGLNPHTPLEPSGCTLINLVRSELSCRPKACFFKATPSVYKRALEVLTNSPLALDESFATRISDWYYENEEIITQEITWEKFIALVAGMSIINSLASKDESTQHCGELLGLLFLAALLKSLQRLVMLIYVDEEETAAGNNVINMAPH